MTIAASTRLMARSMAVRFGDEFDGAVATVMSLILASPYAAKSWTFSQIAVLVKPGDAAPDASMLAESKRSPAGARASASGQALASGGMSVKA